MPVISPAPFSWWKPAKSGSAAMSSRGTMTVTPVRTGPCPITSGPSPESRSCALRGLPATSVMAFQRPVSKLADADAEVARAYRAAQATLVRSRSSLASRRIGHLVKKLHARVSRFDHTGGHHILPAEVFRRQSGSIDPWILRRRRHDCGVRKKEKGMTPTSASLLNRRRFVGMGAALSAAMAMGFPRFDATALAQSAEQTLAHSLRRTADVRHRHDGRRYRHPVGQPPVRGFDPLRLGKRAAISRSGEELGHLDGQSDLHLPPQRRPALERRLATDRPRLRIHVQAQSDPALAGTARHVFLYPEGRRGLFHRQDAPIRRRSP